MEKQDCYRSKYDLPNNYNYKIPSQQMGYFNPYAPMGKNQMDTATQMNMFQM
jgi:hypothetical protein